MLANPIDVCIQIGLHRFNAHAQILLEPIEIWQTLQQFMTESPTLAHYLFGWEEGRDRMDRADFSEDIHWVAIVRFIKKTE